jgi:hypothetical protein
MNSGPRKQSAVSQKRRQRSCSRLCLSPGTLRHSTDQEQSNIVIAELQRISHDPRWFGEDTHPSFTTVGLVLFVMLREVRGVEYSISVGKENTGRIVEQKYKNTINKYMATQTSQHQWQNERRKEWVGEDISGCVGTISIQMPLLCRIYNCLSYVSYHINDSTELTVPLRRWKTWVSRSARAHDGRGIRNFS